MWKRIKTGWEFSICSFKLLWNNKKLLTFQLFTIVGVIGIFGSIIASIIIYASIKNQGLGDVFKSLVIQTGSQSNSEFQFTPTGFLIFSVFYVLSMFVATFNNVGMCQQALDALRGKSVNIASGVLFSVSRIKAIFLWSLLAGLIGVLIMWLERQVESVNKLILKGIGIGWNIAVIFSLPVLIVRNDLNDPIAILRESVSTLKKKWGEAIMGSIGLTSTMLFVQFMIVLILFFIGAIAIALNYGALFLIALIIGLFLMVVVSFMSLTAKHIFRCILFEYATTGNLPSGISPEVVEKAWVKR